MFQNYLKVALRNLLKSKVFSAINITGLGIGLACVIVIFAYVQLELSYDKFHPQYENIYRVTTFNRANEHTANNYLPLGPLLKENMNGIVRSVRIFPHTGLVSVNKKDKFRESNFCYADSGFFKMFNFKVIDGSLESALNNPMALVISKSKALQYFGTTEVAGQELYMEDNGGTNRYNIVAVMEDMPENSHFNLHFIASMESLNTVWPEVFRQEKAWYWPPTYLYIQMTDGHSIGDVNDQLASLASTHLPQNVRQKSFVAQKLTDIHLNSSLLNEWQANSSYSYIQIFSTIAAFILILACINYVNLATSRSLQRAGEIGIRKAMGSERMQLVKMFFGESLVTSGLAIVMGLALAQVSMSLLFNPLLNKELSIDFFAEGINLIYLLMGWLLVSVMAGIYPALYISSFNAIQALKGKGSGIGAALGLRKGLVVFQFFISALLLVGTFVVIDQVDYLRTKNLGFSRDHILTIPLNDAEDRKNSVALKDRMLTQSFVKDAAVSAALPAGEGFFDWEIVPEGHLDTKDLVVRTIGADEDFLKTYQIKVISGRDFSKDILSDQEQGFIINRSLAKQLDWDNPVGKEFQLTFYTDGANVRKGKVIGMVEDFHFQSLYDKIGPLVIFINKHPYYTNHLSLHLEAGNVGDQLSALQAQWKSFNPDRPFEFSLLEENLESLYDNEMATSRLLTIFTALSVIISCLGLFGLTSFTVQLRTKEIGVRKVLGASEFRIVRLLSNEFLVMVMIANVLAWPLAWYGVNQWLAKFAYHVHVSPLIFVMTITVILVITFVAVGVHTFKAALANPVDTLRRE